jgi:general secretion pathway protein G
MHPWSKSGQQRGITLFELMIAVTVVALLGSFAIPAYTAYVERARVGRAVGDIGTLSLQLYRWQSATLRFPDTLAEANLDGRVDPWGRGYQYLNIATSNPGQRRRDKNLVPINTDFDLYSIGKDGDTVTPLTAKASLDDVVRANNGGFIGLGKDY